MTDRTHSNGSRHNSWHIIITYNLSSVCILVFRSFLQILSPFETFHFSDLVERHFGLTLAVCGI